MSDPAINPHAGRSEVEVAADTICAIFRARLLLMTRGSVSEVSIATKVPAKEIKQAWARMDAGLWRPPSSYQCEDVQEVGNQLRDVSRRAGPTGKRQNHQPKPQAIPDDATEWTCSAAHCTMRNPQPIDQFVRRADKGTRRTTCSTCRKKYQRDRYLSIETSERLGTILRFIIQQGDPCEGDDCQRCHGPMLAGQEVETDDVLLVHHAACPS
jgi:hypothetical protein